MCTHQTRQAIEAALAEDPDDLAAHSAYADLLMETGDPRGEFIQVQLALEAKDLSWVDRKRLQHREKDLLAEHGSEWLAPLREIFEYPVPDEDIRFARGWISDLFATRVSQPQAIQLATLPDMRLLRRLHIGDSDQVEAGELAAPSRSCLRNVRVFQLGFDPKDLPRTAAGSGPVVPFLVHGMPRLREMILFAREPRAGVLFELPTLTRLRILRYERGTSYPLALLAENPALRRLRRLICVPRPLVYGEGPPIGRDDLAVLVHSSHLPRLTHLCLCLSDFGDEGCEEIVESGILEWLLALDLSHGTITDEGARLLAECPDANNLQSLNLSANALTSEGIAVLKARLPGVRLLVGGQHQEGDEDYLQEGDWE